MLSEASAWISHAGSSTMRTCLHHLQSRQELCEGHPVVDNFLFVIDNNEDNHERTKGNTVDPHPEAERLWVFCAMDCNHMHNDKYKTSVLH